MKAKKIIHTIYEEKFSFNRKEAGLFFLGVGLTLFILNMVSMLNLLPFLFYIKDNLSQPFLGFYISTLSSVIFMGYSLFNIYEEN